MPLLRSTLLALILLPAQALAGWSCQSGEEQAALLELYTSQGCSSCPPADRWLSAAKQNDRLWSEIVPVAWHVTYWDYIGWRDPFGRRNNDQRQRRMAASAGTQVYTPGMFMNRGEYRRWRRSAPGTVDTSGQAVGTLAAQEQNGRVTVTFTPSTGVDLKKPRLELVYLRSGQHTAVKAGENRGRELRNDFVAGELHTAKLVRSGDSWTATLDAAADSGSEAVALWVTDRRGNYLQATGTWLDSSSQ